MSILFFDTETTGFYDSHLDLNDPRQVGIMADFRTRGPNQ